jgi:nuclear pore complex protein Nup54
MNFFSYILVFILQLKGPNADLSKRVNSLLSTSRLVASTGGQVYVPNSAKVEERSVTELLEVRLEVYH